MNTLKKIDDFWKGFGQQPNRKLNIEERNYFFGLQTKYLILENVGNRKIKYEIKINRPIHHIKNEFNLKLNNKFSPEFNVSYSSGFLNRLIKRETIYSNKKVGLKINHLVNELSKTYDSFQIISKKGLAFKSNDLLKTFEQIKKTRDLLIEIEKAI